jgi:topoisomerase-4 subunit B
MAKSYDAADIEVLSGLEPVRRRPGMYTDTSRPNHLAHEVIDNSIDEALAGHCKKIEVTIYKDGSLEVADDGRGMPVDKHPKEKLPGVEVILTKLHAGGKFSNKNYQFSGGLHGVGVSVVNALSKNLEVWIRRSGKEYNMSFAGGKKRGKLEQVGTVGKANTGTTIRFWPDPQYFDSPKFSISRLKHALRATDRAPQGREAEGKTRVVLLGWSRRVSPGGDRRCRIAAGRTVFRQHHGQQ